MKIPRIFSYLLLIVAGVFCWFSLPDATGRVHAAEALAPGGVSSIGDLVWHDTTPDGVYDPNTEFGLDGITVELREDDNGQPGALLDSMQTGDDPNTGVVEQGWYEFSEKVDFSPSRPLYWIVIPPQPGLAGYQQTSTGRPNPAPVYSTSSANFTDVDFGFARISIELEKTVAYGHDGSTPCPGADKLSGESGMAITYCFQVTNTGDTDLRDVVITDTLLNLPTDTVTLAPGSSYPPLAAGDSVTFYFQSTITDDVVNVAEVTGIPIDDQGEDIPDVDPPTDSDEAEVEELTIAIALEKTAYIGVDNGLSCEVSGSDLTTGLGGAALIYCFKVTNTGDSLISYVSISDDDLGINSHDVLPVTGSGQLPLGPGESIIYYVATSLDRSLINVATATGTPTDENNVEIPVDKKPKSSDTTEVRLADPQIAFEKSVYRGHTTGLGCDYATDSLAGALNAAVTYCFKVTNTSTNAAITETVISDADLGIQPTNVASGSLPLQPGDSITYYYEDAITGNLHNTATATAAPTDLEGNPIPGAENLEETDSADVYVADPGIAIEKTVYIGHNDGASCTTNSVDSIVGINDTPITYCFAVTNTSPQAYLANIEIDDAILGIDEQAMQQLPGNLSPLPPGETVYYYSETILDGDKVNTAKTTGTPSDSQGNPIPDVDAPKAEDTANVLEASADINLEKTVYAGDNGGRSCPGVERVEVPNGSAATFCFEVKNTGTNAYLDKIALYDPVLGITQEEMTKVSGDLPLAPDSTIVYYYVLAEVEGELPNVATVTAVPTDSQGTPIPGAENPADADTAKVIGVGPDINIEKTVYSDHDGGASCPGVNSLVDGVGSAITYCFEVKNTGNMLRLNPITVTDPQLGINQEEMELASGSLPLVPGATIVYYYETTVDGPLTNTATATGVPINENGNPVSVPPPSDEDSVEVDVPAGSTVGDQVWSDLNTDGIQDANEPGLAGITVTLFDYDNNKVDATTTDTNGFYSFTDLPSGRYYLAFSLPNDLYAFSPQYAGDDPALDSDANPETGRTDVFLLESGEVDDTRDAGIFAPPKLQIIKTSNVSSAETGDTIIYVLTYGNSGLSTAPDVRLIEKVPDGTVFQAGKSTPGWSCPDGSEAGTDCEFVVGPVEPEETGNTLFAVKLIDDPKASDVVVNRVVIFDTVYEGIEEGITLDEDTEAVVRQPTAVVLSRFVAMPGTDSIHLEWVTSSEQDTAGFHIFRSTSTRQKNAAKVTDSLILALGPSGGSYSYLDESSLPDVPYYYWLVELETDDDELWYGPVSSVLASDSGTSSSGKIYLPMLLH